MLETTGNENFSRKRNASSDEAFSISKYSSNTMVPSLIFAECDDLKYFSKEFARWGLAVSNRNEKDCV